MCPFGREFTVADLPRLKGTDALAVRRTLTKEELIQNKLIQALTEYQSPNCQRANIDIVIEYQYGSGFMSSTYSSPSKDNVAVIFVPIKQGKAFLKKGPGWSRFDQFARKSSLDSQIKTASAHAAKNCPPEDHPPEHAMTAIREGYGEFALYPNEDLEGISLVHGGGQVKVNGVLYELQRPLSMQDCVKLDAITDRPKRYKVDDYFPRRDPYDPYK